ncbi:olfactory receptor 1019-like [Bombina bombina]|uniref:olfactory receptor 1019-like n=1 Tax=Bombina bombina TaxID=8345 RepID=UPI00235A9451|nr:olfactory receptor 1019-like [Bombina bombina]
MEIYNKTSVIEFVLLGFYDHPDLQFILFTIFTSLYITALLTNLLTIAVVSLAPQLHSPMYILLCNMSLLDISFTTMVIPKLLDIFVTGNHTISYSGCITQIFFFVFLIVSEYYILAVMAYDRYVAICIPLRYQQLMSNRVCLLLASLCWCVGLLEAVLYAILISQCLFCKSNQINHLFCDIKPMIKLSCSDTRLIETMIHGPSAFIGFIPSVLTLVSYAFIITTVMKIPSSKGRYKTFSTCSSHLTVIIMYYGTILCMYMRPKSAYAIDQDKFFAILYTAVIPVLNPLIYTLRNQEVKGTLFKKRGKT